MAGELTRLRSGPPRSKRSPSSTSVPNVSRPALSGTSIRSGPASGSPTCTIGPDEPDDEATAGPRRLDGCLDDDAHQLLGVERRGERLAEAAGRVAEAARSSSRSASRCSSCSAMSLNAVSEARRTRRCRGRRPAPSDGRPRSRSPPPRACRGCRRSSGRRGTRRPRSGRPPRAARRAGGSGSDALVRSASALLGVAATSTRCRSGVERDRERAVVPPVDRSRPERARAAAASAPTSNRRSSPASPERARSRASSRASIGIRGDHGRLAPGADDGDAARRRPAMGAFRPCRRTGVRPRSAAWPGARPLIAARSPSRRARWKARVARQPRVRAISPPHSSSP